MSDEQSITFQLVLQTVGNSIINYSNDITHSETHNKRMKNRFTAEAHALSNVYPFTVDDIANSFQRYVVAKKKSAEQVKSQESEQEKQSKMKEEMGVYNALAALKVTVSDQPDFPLEYFEREVREKIKDSGHEEKKLEILKSFMDQQINLSIQYDAIEAKGDPRKVIDTLILALQYRLLKAQLEGNDEHINRLRTTIEASYKHRAGMVYIKPASAYLRSSFAASSLQRDGGSFDNNMLTHNWYENIPVAGDIYSWAFKRNDRRYNIVRNDIDKQNWQTINRVRVKGTGKTNYVLVKDDVGNWYVKNYSTDDRKIVKSARNLLLYSTGHMSSGLNSLKADAALPEESPNSPADASIGSELQDENSVPSEESKLVTLVEKSRQRYLEKSISDYKRVKTWYSDEVPAIIANHLRLVCGENATHILSTQVQEFKSADVFSGERRFAWLEDNIPKETEDDLKLHKNLTEKQQSFIDDIGNRLIEQVKPFQTTLPMALNQWVAGNGGNLCTMKQVDESDEAYSYEFTNLATTVVGKVHSQLVKPFINQRQEFVSEQNNMALTLQEVIID